MEELISKSDFLVKKHARHPKRSIYEDILWDAKLIGIKGARGIGKTTLLLQRLSALGLSPQEALYISLDDWYFTQHSLIETADNFIKKGGKVLFIDEVHKYESWSVQIKNLYDFTDLTIVFTGSSILDISKEEGDLSRRVVMYTMQGLSFREYLSIAHQLEFPKFTFDALTQQPSVYFQSIFPDDFKPYKYFDEYLQFGYYPIFGEGKQYYTQKLQQMVRQIVEFDMAELKGYDSRNSKKMLQLLGLIAQQVPFKPNIQKLSEKMDMNRQTLYNYFVFLGEAKLISLLYQSGFSTAILQKPEKVYFENTNLAFALAGSHQNAGTLRETFVLNQLQSKLDVKMANEGDFVVNQQITLEVGGANKSKKQIKDIEQSFRVLDGIEFISSKDIIPIWLLGFLY